MRESRTKLNAARHLTRSWKQGVLSLVGATFAAAALTASTAAAASRSLNAYTTDADRGGFMEARITYGLNKGGDGYHGNIQGRYEDRAADGHCIQGFRSGSGGARRYSLGPPVCPKGHSQSFDYHYRRATKAVVMVCRVSDKTHRLENCSGWK